MKRTSSRIAAMLLSAGMAFTGCAPAENSDRTMVDQSKIKYADSYNFEKRNAVNVEKTECSILVEAENAETAAGVAISADLEGYSGTGYADITDNKSFRLTVDIPANQYYKLTVRHRAEGHKENPLMFNGVKAMNIYSDAGDWQESTINGIYLEKGENTITIGDGWSYFSLDSIKIEDGESLSDSLYENVASTLSNPYANLKTQNIYQYLKAIYGEYTLAGQCTDYGKNTETDALFKGLGKYPAVRTFDFIFDSINNCDGNPQAKDVDLAIQWDKDGGLVVFDWHWHAPCHEAQFYTEKTKFRLENAVTEKDLAMLSAEEVQKLYDKGEISEEAYWIIKDIDNISALMQRMEDENVTVMWRPLHEASGGWFWWGASGAENYKWLWKLMYKRMTDLHKLDNLIWIWNGQAADWYPGDEYCDISAIDIYNAAHDYGASPDVFAEVSGWGNNGKLVAMSECAAMPDPEFISRDNAYWLWFAVWNWDYIVLLGTTHLSDKYTSFEMMEKVYNSDIIITRDELPKELFETGEE